MNAKKIIVAISLEAEIRPALMRLKTMGIDSKAEVHFVHIVPVILYARGMALRVMTYPLVEERPKIEEAIIAQMVEIQRQVLPECEKVIYKCLFDANEKAAFTEYVEQQKADLVVVATRGKRGLSNFFDSSFAQHQIKYSPANVLVLR